MILKAWVDRRLILLSKRFLWRLPSCLVAFKAPIAVAPIVDFAKPPTPPITPPTTFPCGPYVAPLLEPCWTPAETFLGMFPNPVSYTHLDVYKRQPVSLSQATAAQLEELDGIGPALAARIIEWRESHGGFSSVDQLEQVPGIGPARMEALRTRVVP